MKKLFLIPLPALLIGSVAMYINGLAISIWILNAIGAVIALLIPCLIIKKPEIIESRFTILIAIVLLMITFLDSGSENIHRWITIGPIRFYIASIILPILIIRLSEMLKTSNWWIAAIISIGVSLLLFLQPDASQATAFIIPMIILLFGKAKNNLYRFSVLGILPVILIFAWIYVDHLAPVAYVE